MATRRLLVLLAARRGELPAGDTIASLPLEPIPRASLPDPTKARGQIFIVSDAPLVGMTITWSDGTKWVRPSALATITLT